MQKWIATGLAALALCGAGFARADKPTLSQKEIQAGWILLFDGETSFGWKPRGDANFKIADGAVEVSSGGKGFLATTTEFADYELHAEVWIDDKANSGIFIRSALEGDLTTKNAYEVNVYDAHKDWPSGSMNDYARSKVKVKTVGKWSSYDITAEGDHFIIKVDGKKCVDVKNKALARGVIALQYNGEGAVKFKNIRLKPLAQKSIFNGKDLTGWVPIPDKKSVFSVTPEGWMNIKSGNGDIQTEAKWGDFVLTLDIFSNGTSLNSGVFYRANFGSFWSGYEAQIRNQWKGDDRTQPVDYGTGGIYNLQPARRVVSSDKEWFTMTVIAHGYHMATWVNGIQVSDHTDTRPVDESNARKGARKSPGVITLQGHDPTTDLSFKNIRVVEYPTAK